MNKGIITLILCLTSLLLIAQNDAFINANKAFHQKNYRMAIEGYETLNNQGFESFELFYNLGTSHYKKGNIGKAILYLEKAKLIEPTNPQLLNNLSIVQEQVKDDIDTISPFFLQVWWNKIYQLLGANIWTILSLLFVWIGIISFSKWVLSKTRKFLFYAIPILFLGFISFFAAKSAADFEVDSKMGVIIESEVSIKSGADDSSEDIMTIHEGLKVKVLDQIGNWYKVRLANGEIGWLSEKAINKI